MRNMNRQLQAMIKQGREALGTRIEIESDELDAGASMDGLTAVDEDEGYGGEAAGGGFGGEASWVTTNSGGGGKEW